MLLHFNKIFVKYNIILKMKASFNSKVSKDTKNTKTVSNTEPIAPELLEMDLAKIREFT